MRKLGLPLAAILMLCSGSCAGDNGQDISTREPAGDWPMYGLDHSNSLHNRTESTLSTENVSQLEERWALDGIGGVTGTPVLTNGTVYFGDWLGFVRAVNARDGSVVWAEKVSNAPISASVAVNHEVVIVGDLAGFLHAVDRETGDALWSEAVSGKPASLFASPVIIGDSVVIGMTDSEIGADDPEFRASIVAVQIADGRERWRVFTSPENSSGMWVPVWSSVAYDAKRGLVFVGTGNTNVPAPSGSPPGTALERSRRDLPLTNSVLAIDLDTGEIVWATRIVEKDEGRDVDVGASPNLFAIEDRDVLGVGAKSGDYVVVDRDTGELVWETHLTKGGDIGGIMATAAVGDSVIYVTSNDAGARGGTIFALDARDGAIIWKRRFDPPIIGGSLTLANGVLYRGLIDLEGSLGTAVALAADDGTVLWTEAINAPLAGGFAVTGGMVYVGYGPNTLPAIKEGEGGILAYSVP